MTSRRQIARRDARWDRYMATIDRSPAPIDCAACAEQHPGVRVTPGFFGTKAHRRRIGFMRTPRYQPHPLPAEHHARLAGDSGEEG